MFYKIINKKKLYMTMVADAIGKLLYLPSALFARPRKIKPNAVSSILLIRTAYIGDVMMTVPMLRPLREHFPNASITFLTSRSASTLLRNNPDLDEVVTFDPFWFHPTASKMDYIRFIRSMRRRHFDLVIESRGDIREILMLVRPMQARFKVSYGVGGGAYMLSHVVPYSQLKHKVEYHLDICRYLGCKVEKPVWDVYLDDSELLEVEQILSHHGVKGPFIAAHPGARLFLKRWATERYAELFTLITEKTGLPLILLGSSTEAPLVGEITGLMDSTPVNLSGKLSLRQMAGLLAQARIFVCNDSAPMHVAAAVSTPTIAIFGPSKSNETAPFGVTHSVVEADMPCRYTCDESICLNEEKHACMQDITVSMVWTAVSKILEKDE